MKIALGHIEGSEEFHGLHLFLPHDSISTPSNWLPDEQPFSCPGFSLHRTRRVSPNRHQFYRDFDSGFSTGLTDTKKWNPYMSFNIVEYGLHHELSATCMPINQAGRTDHYKWTTSYLANLLLLYRSLKWSCSSPVNWGESRRNLFDKFHKPEVPQTRVLNILTILFAPTSISHPGSSIVRNLQNIPKQGKPRWTWRWKDIGRMVPILEPMYDCKSYEDDTTHQNIRYHCTSQWRGDAREKESYRKGSRCLKVPFVLGIARRRSALLVTSFGKCLQECNERCKQVPCLNSPPSSEHWYSLASKA